MYVCVCVQRLDAWAGVCTVNPSGAYLLDLSHPVEHYLAQRLKAAALAEHSSSGVIKRDSRCAVLRDLLVDGVRLLQSPLKFKEPAEILTGIPLKFRTP